MPSVNRSTASKKDAKPVKETASENIASSTFNNDQASSATKKDKTKPAESTSFLLYPIHCCMLPLVLSPISDTVLRTFQSICGLRDGGKKRFFPLHCIFKLASALGEEMFGLIPLFFWIDVEFAGTFITHFMVLLMTGQIVKDMLRLPRPLHNDIIRLEQVFATEYGFPSTHTLSGAIPLSVMYQYANLNKVAFTSAQWSYAFLYAVLVALSRMYLGVHSCLDILGGIAISIMGLLYLGQHGACITNAFVYEDNGIYYCLFTTLAFLFLYPRARPWRAGYGTAAIILGTSMGVFSALYTCHHSGIWGQQVLHTLRESSHTVIDYYQIWNAADQSKLWFVGKRYLIASIACGLTKVISKEIIVQIMRLMLHLGIVNVHKDELVDSEGNPVPWTKSYAVEVPVRLFNYGFLAWVTVIGTPLLWKHFQT